IDLAEETKEQIRLLARGLRPSTLDTVGLNLTLESFCRDYARRTQIPIDYRGIESDELSDAAAMCVYRTLQEALNNIAKHADAARARVSLHRTVETVTLVVEDDGVGFTVGGHPRTEDRSPGIGLIGIAERLELFGGKLDLAKSKLGGARLSATLPLEGSS
ncbi:MAG: sensor histidine kinase, partial [Proteobacteria bacterium]